MKKFTVVLSISMIFLACNNAKEPAAQGKDTSASSSADSIKMAVDRIKADSAAKHSDTMPRKDSIKK